jgi:hypothetical protein
MPKNIVCNVRLTEDMRHSFRIAALKNKTTVQDVLFEAVQRYISESETGGGDCYSTEEEAADIAYIEAHRGEPSFPLSEVLRDYEAQHGSFPPRLADYVKWLAEEAEIAALEARYGTEPSAETAAAIEECGAGTGKKFPGIAGLMADLHDGNGG